MNKISIVSNFDEYLRIALDELLNKIRRDEVVLITHKGTLKTGMNNIRYNGGFI
jgi:hypothetical protein